MADSFTALQLPILFYAMFTLSQLSTSMISGTRSDIAKLKLLLFFTMFHVATIRFNQMEMGPTAATQIKSNQNIATAQQQLFSIWLPQV